MIVAEIKLTAPQVPIWNDILKLVSAEKRWQVPAMSAFQRLKLKPDSPLPAQFWPFDY